MKRFVFIAMICAIAGCPDDLETPTPPPANTTPTILPQLKAVPDDVIEALLPKDADGRPVLWGFADGPVVLGDAPEPGPNTASAGCVQLESSCFMATKGEGDKCADLLPVCQTETPWAEAAPCCPQACIDAYHEERRLGASILEAGGAVWSSAHECFPGLREWYRERGDPNPRLMPRRGPMP